MPGLHPQSVNGGIASSHWFFFDASCLSASSFFSSVAIAILSQVFLKPQNNLVSVLLAYHMKCPEVGISGKIAERILAGQTGSSGLAQK